MSFEPVAIVGRSCIFPGAFTPAQFWNEIAAGADLIRPCSPERMRVPREYVLSSSPHRLPDIAVTDRGGYVEGFGRIFDPSGFAVPPHEILPLDELFHWLLHTGREALRDAAIDAPAATPPRTGCIFGLLALPTESLIRFAESVWLGEPYPGDPRNRFCGGFTAHLLARALRLDRGAFALDAACASSLYAIKLACDCLQEGTADIMLAGAASRGDALYLQIGFSALSAASPSGRIRPFSADADGLLPAEGASFVVLKRLEDARRANDHIHAVIRGIGIGNDGRTAALLAPSVRGQMETIRSSYLMSGLEPAQISLIECHATGTPVGDACEIRSTGRVFAGLKNVPIGSVKSNLGHPMTAAGMAGLLKILSAMEAGIRPRMLHVDSPSSQIERIAASPFRLLTANESWDSAGPRRAALSAFGFGGNNAHMLVEQWTGHFPGRPVSSTPPRRSPIAVISIGASVGNAPDAETWARKLFLKEPVEARTPSIDLELESLGFPPRDLEESLPPQAVALRVATEALAKVGPLPSRTTGVFVGAGIDPEMARLSLHFRRRLPPDHPRLCPHLTAAAVIGRLANIVANRISNKYNLRGVSFTVHSEEISGLTALDLACRGLRRGDIDAAIVGAIDLACEAIHEASIASVIPERAGQALDAAVFVVLKRLEDAEAVGDPILATIPEETPGGATTASSLPAWGFAHNAGGLLDAVNAVLCCAHMAVGPKRPWISAGDSSAIRIDVDALGGASAGAIFVPNKVRVPSPVIASDAPRIFLYAAGSRERLVDALRHDRQGTEGASRLAIIAASDAEFARKRERALHELASSTPSFGVNGIWYRERPLGGEVAFVFPGAAAAYKGAGGSLLLAFPETLASVRQWAPRFVSSASWLFAATQARATPVDKLWACTALTQCHAHLTRRILNIHADAAIGMSSGEMNALFAFHVWRDADDFSRELLESELFERHLGGACEVLNGTRWETWLFSVPEPHMLRIAAAEQALRILAIHMPGEYLLAGDPATLRRAIRLAGTHRTQRVDFDLVVHAPEAAPFAEIWRQLHHRKSTTPEGMRFYQMAGGRAFRLTRDSIADSLTDQVLNTLDFPRLVEAAWADGVRVFLEHGPRGGCSTWIRGILGNREHAAIPLDLPGVDPLIQAAHAVAQLFVAGVSVDVDQFSARVTPRQAPKGRILRLPAHLPVIEPLLAASGRTPGASSLPVAPREVGKASVALFAAHAAGLASSWESYLSRTSEAFQSVLQSLPSAPAAKPRVDRPASGPKFTRADLEKTSCGKISEVFGPLFEPLDHYRRIVRLPMPPMLLADRILSIDGVPGSMGTGSLLAETDILPGAWYLHCGRMPAGIVIEAGQADMLLISWLGIDFHVKGERIYRLLGCDLTYHSEMPGPGVTLRYHIRITGHARQGGVRIFFFEYDCHAGGRLIASVRNAQAGFFTDDELKNSAGILWSAEQTIPRQQANIAAPRVPGVPRAYSNRQLRAAAAGDAFDCFGRGFEASSAQQRPPSFAGPKLLLIDSISDLDFAGGPWGRGYLRAEYHVLPDNWLFACHFKDDPCLPGTLMFEGAIQCMAFYLMALGFTLDRDGWRFEPVSGEPYLLRCRGQITPASKLMVCELFVEEIVEGPEPILYAHVLGSVDGLKAFHCRGMAVRLAPGNPLDEFPGAVPEARHVAEVNGVPLDSKELLACALGSSARASGTPFTRFQK